MKLKSGKSDLTFRRLKLSDYYEFKNYFIFVLKKGVSYFYKWRYFKNRLSFCCEFLKA